MSTEDNQIEMSQEEPNANEQNIDPRAEEIQKDAENAVVNENTTEPSAVEETAPAKVHPAGFDVIKSEVERLKKEHKTGESYNYRSFFNHAKQIIEIFKHTRDISDAERKELWDEYRELCDKVDQLRKAEYSSTEAVSHQLKEELLEELKTASELVQGVYDKTTFQVAKDKFKSINNMLVARSKRLHREDADYCWQEFRTSRAALDEKLHIVHSASLEEAKSFYAAAEHAVNKENNPFDAMKIVIREREKTKELILSRDDTDAVVAQFNELWRQLTVRLDDFKKSRKQKRAERTAKRKEWIERQRENRDKNIERAAKLSTLIETIAKEIADLEVKKAEASGEEFREKIQGWITAKQTKMDEFKKVVAGINSTLKKFSAEISKNESAKTSGEEKAE